MSSESVAETLPIRINATDFAAAQRANRRNTIWLILILLLLGGGFGYVLGWAWENVEAGGYETADLLRPSMRGMIGGLILLSIGVGATAVTFAAGDKVVLKLNNAREVSAQQEPLLHNVVEEMAIAAGLPMPKIAIIESEAMNAFATGMYPESAAIGVTRGLLNGLSREELQGVIAHEMGHILNWDTRYMTAVGILVGRRRRGSHHSRRGFDLCHSGADRRPAGAICRLAPARVPGGCHFGATDPQSRGLDRCPAEAGAPAKGNGTRQSRDPASFHRQPDP
jgi:Peptidase family M48